MNKPQAKRDSQLVDNYGPLGIKAVKAALEIQPPKNQCSGMRSAGKNIATFQDDQGWPEPVVGSISQN